MIKRIYKVALEVQTKGDDIPNEIDELLYDIYDIVKSYHEFVPELPSEMRERMFFSYVIPSMISDEGFDQIDSAKSLQTFLSGKLYQVDNEVTCFDMNISSYFSVCRYYDYEASISVVLSHLALLIISHCVESTDISLSSRLKYISTFSKIHKESTHSNGMMGELVEKMSSLSDSKISDIVGDEHVDFLADSMVMILSGEGHGEFGENMGACLKGVKDMGGKDAIRHLYGTLAKDTDNALKVANDFMKRLELEELPVGKVWNKLSDNIRENKDLFKEFKVDENVVD